MKKFVPEAYLHRTSHALYNPITNRTLRNNQDGYQQICGRGGLVGALRDELCDDGWLIEDDCSRRDHRYYLKYVSLEGNSGCNQRCGFCPVSLAPRTDHSMELALYERIASQLASFSTLEGVFMNHYNEPTTSPNFIEHIRILQLYSLPIALLTNGTGLSPKRVDQIRDLGELGYLCINLSTVDREKYRQERQRDHLELVLKHLDYLCEKPVSARMEIVALGPVAEVEALRSRFSGGPFVVRAIEPNDRAANHPQGNSVSRPLRGLCGCEQMGSRPLQHLHITAQGSCVLCCQDFHEKYVVGDLKRQSVEEVLRGPEMAKYRRWTYGLEEAPEDYLCRTCVYAKHS